MTTPRGFRDRADDSLLTLVGDLPELIRNLIVAEIDHAKNWVKGAAKDAGFGTGWMVVALFFLFWSIPVFGTFVIAGLSSWWPVWLSAIVVFGILLLAVLLFALLGILKFRKVLRRQNPAQAVAEDIRLVKDAGDDRL
jgi:hypothetical protein